MRVAVTGASGFIGTALMPALAAAGHVAVALPRTDYARLLQGADALIHLAGLAHRTGAAAPRKAEFIEVNARLPLCMQQSAREARVPHMVHLSSIAVLSGQNDVLREEMPLAPTTPYDHAKAQAERDLEANAGGSTLTIVRPPLVYGPGAKGNLRSLLRLCALPLPLPFGAVHNRRSLVSRSNLVDALLFLLAHPVQGIAHVTDDCDLSLPELLTVIRRGMGKEPGLLPIPPNLLGSGLRALGRHRISEQLLGDSRVEMTRLPALGWYPPHVPETDLLAMAQAYVADRRSTSAAVR